MAPALDAQGRRWVWQEQADPSCQDPPGRQGLSLLLPGQVQPAAYHILPSMSSCV